MTRKRKITQLEQPLDGMRSAKTDLIIREIFYGDKNAWRKLTVLILTSLSTKIRERSMRTIREVNEDYRASGKKYLQMVMHLHHVTCGTCVMWSMELNVTYGTYIIWQMSHRRARNHKKSLSRLSCEGFRMSDEWMRQTLTGISRASSLDQVVTLKSAGYVSRVCDQGVSAGCQQCVSQRSWEGVKSNQRGYPILLWWSNCQKSSAFLITFVHPVCIRLPYVCLGSLCARTCVCVVRTLKKHSFNLFKDTFKLFLTLYRSSHFNVLCSILTDSVT